MIQGIHGMFYSNKPEELRAFLRDKLQLPFTDTGEGWLIFDFPVGDLGVHPTDESNDSMSGAHDISFFTADIAATVQELKSRGVEFEDEITDRVYGLVTHLVMPGGVRVQLYQPRYEKKALMAPAPEPAKPPAPPPPTRSTRGKATRGKKAPSGRKPPAKATARRRAR